MSRYLIDRIQALPNVDLHLGKEVVALEGDRDGLKAAVFRQRATGATYACPISSSVPVHRRRSQRRLAPDRSRWIPRASC